MHDPYTQHAVRRSRRGALRRDEVPARHLGLRAGVLARLAAGRADGRRRPRRVALSRGRCAVRARDDLARRAAPRLRGGARRLESTRGDALRGRRPQRRADDGPRRRGARAQRAQACAGGRSRLGARDPRQVGAACSCCRCARSRRGRPAAGSAISGSPSRRSRRSVSRRSSGGSTGSARSRRSRTTRGARRTTRSRTGSACRRGFSRGVRRRVRLAPARRRRAARARLGLAFGLLLLALPYLTGVVRDLAARARRVGRRRRGDACSRSALCALPTAAAPDLAASRQRSPSTRRLARSRNTSWPRAAIRVRSASSPASRSIAAARLAGLSGGDEHARSRRRRAARGRPRCRR